MALRIASGGIGHTDIEDEDGWTLVRMLDTLAHLAPRIMAMVEAERSQPSATDISRLNSATLAVQLTNLLSHLAQDSLALAPYDEIPAGAEVKTYEEAGIATMERGLILEMPNGDQYDINILPVNLERAI
jgi:hypothetical protein